MVLILEKTLKESGGADAVDTRNVNTHEAKWNSK